MNKLKRMALIGLLTKRFKESHSWCGETHVQKAIYFLQELLEVPLNYEFVLYKFGPFSFALRDDLSECVACELIDVVPNDYPYGCLYGPRLRPTPHVENLMSKFPKTLQKYASQVNCVTNWLGPKDASELERLSTALYVLKKRPDLAENEKGWIDEVHRLKPHQSKEEISQAVKELQSFVNEGGAWDGSRR